MLQVGVEVDERQSDSELEILRNLVAAFEMVDRKALTSSKGKLYMAILFKTLFIDTDRKALTSIGAILRMVGAQ